MRSPALARQIKALVIFYIFTSSFSSAIVCTFSCQYTHKEVCMRTNIVIDDSLMNDALKVTGLKTKKEAVEQGLKLLVKRNKQKDIRKLRGKLNWEGNLDEMRSS